MHEFTISVFSIPFDLGGTRVLKLVAFYLVRKGTTKQARSSELGARNWGGFGIKKEGDHKTPFELEAGSSERGIRNFARRWVWHPNNIVYASLLFHCKGALANPDTSSRFASTFAFASADGRSPTPPAMQGRSFERTPSSELRAPSSELTFRQPQNVLRKNGLYNRRAGAKIP